MENTPLPGDNSVWDAPSGPQHLAVMAFADAPGKAQCYGAERGCHPCRVPRSTYNAARQTEDWRLTCRSRSWYSPKFTIGDADLLYAIRANLQSSPLSSEGRNKDWALLRIQEGLTAVRSGSLSQVLVEATICAIRRLSTDVAKSAQILMSTPTKSNRQEVGRVDSRLFACRLLPSLTKHNSAVRLGPNPSMWLT